MPRTKKDRSAEIQAVFEGLKYCDIATLNEVINKAGTLIYRKRNSEIEMKKQQLAELQAEIAKLEEDNKITIVDENGNEIK